VFRETGRNPVNSQKLLVANVLSQEKLSTRTESEVAVQKINIQYNFTFSVTVEFQKQHLRFNLLHN